MVVGRIQFLTGSLTRASISLSVVEGGVGDVRGERPPDPVQLLELLYFAECSSLFSTAKHFAFF